MLLFEYFIFTSIEYHYSRRKSRHSEKGETGWVKPDGLPCDGSAEYPDFEAEDLKPALTEMKRIGNNLNQITAKINVGAFKSYNFSEVIEWQSKLYEELVRIGGKHWQQ